MIALDLRLGMSMGLTALLVLLPRRIWMTSGHHPFIGCLSGTLLQLFLNASWTAS
jgi:hypothetical protein